MVTAEQLKKLKIDPFLAGPLNETFKLFNINTPLQQAAFIAQCGHESGNFTKLEEDLRYRAATLFKMFPKTPKRAWGFASLDEAMKYQGHPERIASRIYGGRMGNRDEASGDGWLYRGSGYLQLTGAANFYHAGKALGVDLVKNPDLVRTPDYAMKTAGWYWSTHKCNALAEAKNWVGLTKAINGGLIGLEDRIHHTDMAMEVCGGLTCSA
jgi:putative chitinase